MATVWLNTHPMNDRSGVTIELGSNRENGGRNRATGARRLAIRLPDATVTAGGTVVVQDGRILWDVIPHARLTSASQP